MLPDSPIVRLLLALEQDGTSVDYLADAGMAGEVKIRHRRKREPVRADRPCHTLIFVGDEAAAMDPGLTQWEILRQLTVDIQTDIELATDASGDDPTGLAVLGRLQAAFIRRVREPDSATRALVDWVIEGDVDPEDRAQAEDGRLVRSLVLQYRVSATDGNVLLAAGENA